MRPLRLLNLYGFNVLILFWFLYPTLAVRTSRDQLKIRVSRAYETEQCFLFFFFFWWGGGGVQNLSYMADGTTSDDRFTILKCLINHYR